MKRFFLSLIILASSLLSAKAQIIFSDSTEISLLTCDMGADSYERFGHTGVRINDLKSGQDIVFHWGVYDFSEPYFVLKFIKGITDYQIGACYTSDFIRQYKRRGLGMSEQKLDLNSQQRAQAIAAILDNYRPENRRYRYSYFFDNCATRPFDVINAATGNAIVYDTTWIAPVTLRDLLQEKTSTNNWLDFGISLAVASRSDRRASFREQMFLPDYLARAYDNASIDGHKLVKGEPVGLLVTTPEVQALIAPCAGSKPLRSCNGFDYSRAAMLLAVLEKRGGLKVSQCDAYLNIIGGLTLDEPAADLAAVVAIASSYLDKPVSGEMAAIGEVGLSGEIRSISHLEQRLSEVQRLGFTRCIVPAHRAKEPKALAHLELLPVQTIAEALQLLVRGK